MLLIASLTLVSLAAVQDTTLAPSRCGPPPQLASDTPGGTAALECYYRLHHDTMDMTLGVLYTREGRITGMFPR